MSQPHPYSDLPDRAFWKRSVSDRHFADLSDLWDGMALTRADKVATAGSCFAQHLGRNLAQRGANFIDMEPAPDFLPDADSRRRWGYDVYSCRYGNIYTVRQLRQLVEEAFGLRSPAEAVWRMGERFVDALRPNIDPVGQPDAETVRQLRARHLERVREMLTTLDVLVFTLGLTEAWVARGDGTVYPTAPGTIAGTYDPARHEFLNFRYPEVMADLEAAWSLIHAENPGARLLLTVSPVPLAATASGGHVLTATTFSKSTLRAVAGDFVAAHPEATYFPSYEIITAAPGRGMYYDPDWRGVNPYGVEMVMRHFFSGRLGPHFGAAAPMAEEGDVICDEEAMMEAVEGA